MNHNNNIVISKEFLLQVSKLVSYAQKVREVSLSLTSNNNKIKEYMKEIEKEEEIVAKSLRTIAEYDEKIEEVIKNNLCLSSKVINNLK